MRAAAPRLPRGPAAVGIVALALALPVWPQQAVDGEDDALWTTHYEDTEPLWQLVASHRGESFAFRYRRVVRDCGKPDEGPELVHDGLVRFRFEGDGIWLHEAYVDLQSQKNRQPVARDRQHFYSLLTGEHTMHMRRSGDFSSEIRLRYWSTLPDVLFLAAGALGSRALSDRIAAGRDGRRFERHDNPRTGSTSIVVRNDAGQPVEYAEVIPGASGDPALILQGVYGDRDCVEEALVFAAVESDWTEADFDRVPAHARLLDFRGSRHAVAAVHTDRPLKLYEAGSWASRVRAEGLAEIGVLRSEPTTAPAPAEPTPARPEPRRLFATLVGAALLFGLLVLVTQAKRTAS
ncbi:MAG: hypothetical protein AAF682_20555 [Planctomycetota bacterium]